MYVNLWRRLLWGLNETTQIPEPFGQSLPTRQCGWGRCGRSLVTKETVTVTFFMWSVGPWIWKRKTWEKDKRRQNKRTQKNTVNASSPTAGVAWTNILFPQEIMALLGKSLTSAALIQSSCWSKPFLFWSSCQWVHVFVHIYYIHCSHFFCI